MIFLRHMALVLPLMVLAVPAVAGDAPVPAATGAVATGAAPLEISADNGLVWDRANRSYVAKGNAEVRQGDMRVTADTLTARYAEEASASDIRNLTAEGRVTLSQTPYTAYGDRADYDVVSGRAVLTGSDLRIVTPDERLTAKDRITYLTADGKMTAEGGAVMTRGTDTLAAQTLTAQFSTDATGARALDTVTAEGGVTITTARETVTGARGVYHGRSQKAELTGGVVIVQGPNRLEGRRATVDMKTGLSQLYGAGGADGRVRGVFYPKSSKVAPAAAITASPSPAVPVPPAAVPVTPDVSVAPAPAPKTEASPAAASVSDIKTAADAVPVPAPAATPVPEHVPPSPRVNAEAPAVPQTPVPASQPPKMAPTAPAAATPVRAKPEPAPTPQAPAALKEQAVPPPAVETPAAPEIFPDEPFAVPTTGKTP